MCRSIRCSSCVSTARPGSVLARCRRGIDLAMTWLPSRGESCLRRGAEMHGQDMLRRLYHFDRLPVAADKGKNGALAVARHAADERDVDVDGLPRLEPRAFNPEAHGGLLRFPAAIITTVAANCRVGKAQRADDLGKMVGTALSAPLPTLRRLTAADKWRYANPRNS